METPNTSAFLESLAFQYPLSRPEDYIKALFQSVYGCGHLITDSALNAAWIAEEAVSAPDIRPAVEPLNGNYVRIYLSALHQSGMRADTLSRIMQLSARASTGTKEQLDQKLSVLLEMAEENRLPVSASEIKQALCSWKIKGYPIPRHSVPYKNAYHPAYRVIHKSLVPFLPVFSAIDTLTAKRSFVLAAIDGGSASGKTTLGNILHEVYDCNIFHMDDFFLQPHQRTGKRLAEPGGNVDRERFQSEVLSPLLRQETVFCRRFDCSAQILTPAVCFPYKPLSIIEGAYSLHPSLTDSYQLKILLDISPVLQKERIRERNTPEMQKKFFNLWIPMEQNYFKQTDIENRCDIIVEVTK